MKKLFTCILLFIFFLGNAIAESKDRNVELNQLFDQLKKSKDVSAAIEVEMKIWNIRTYYRNSFDPEKKGS